MITPILYLKKGNTPLYPIYNMGDGFVRVRTLLSKRRKRELHFTQLRLSNGGDVRAFIQTLPSIEMIRTRNIRTANELYGGD